MEAQELGGLAEEIHDGRERQIGLTMAVIAACLAVVTLMGHRLHTEEIVNQTKATDGWAYYQAKNGRYHMYSTDATLAELTGAANAAAVAADWKKKAQDEEQQAEDIRKVNERLDAETEATAHRATFFDGAEICLEVAIVLCSIALLTGSAMFWYVSFVGAAIGVGIAAVGWFR